MEKKKIIFMDVDGVLNYTKWYMSDRNPGNLNGQEGDIDPKCVERVKKICDETGAKIVLSSDWRITWPGSLNRLNRAGFEGYLIDKTPEFIWQNLSKSDYFNDNYEDIYEYSRGAEIDAWLKEHDDTYDYLILDDRTDFTPEQTRLHFVHINSMYGITNKDVKKGIEILSR